MKKKKRKASTRPQKKEEKWEDANRVIEVIPANGIYFTRRNMMKPLSVLPSQGKEVRADIPDLRNEIDEKLRRVGWKEIFKRLHPAEHCLVDNHYFQGISLKEIAQSFHVSYPRVLKVHKKALHKLKSPEIVNLMRKFDFPGVEEWYEKNKVFYGER